MGDKFVVFNHNPPNISSSFSSSDRLKEWEKINSEINKILLDYKGSNLEYQELEFFSLIDKKFENMSHNHFLKIVNAFMNKIKEDIKKNSIKFEEFTPTPIKENTFILTYKNIFYIVDIIMTIIDNIKTKDKLCDVIYDFAYGNKRQMLKDNEQ